MYCTFLSKKGDKNNEREKYRNIRGRKTEYKKLSKTEAKIFYSTLLSAAIEYYSNIDENAPSKAENPKTAG